MKNQFLKNLIFIYLCNRIESLGFLVGASVFYAPKGSEQNFDLGIHKMFEGFKNGQYFEKKF